MSHVQELLNRDIKVLLRSPDIEERCLTVRICIELHSSTSPNHKKDLIVRLTDDTDPYFLYNLVLSEEDFQSLKVQQGLLVDFSAFPQKFIDLLYQCMQDESKENPRFLLQLSSSSVLGGSHAQLDVIEKNAFKHLTHLSLRMLPATDIEIKGYLAKCLRYTTEEKNMFQKKLKKTEEDFNRQMISAQQSLSEKSQELERIKCESSTKIASLTSQQTVELAKERENAQKAYAQLVQQHEQQKNELENSFQRNTQQMQSRLTELEISNKEQLEKRFKAEATIRELRAKNQGLEEESQRSQQKIVSLQRENSTLDTECHEKEKEVNRLQTRLAVLEQELRDKEQLVLRSNEVLKATQEQKASLEESSEKRQVQIGKLEATIKSLSAELLKANDIIKKLQVDLKRMMGKLKLKNAVTVQQEKLLADHEKRLQGEQKELQESKQSLRLRDEETDKLREQLQQTEQKLQESKELLKNNENVINWLNKQLNENQCGVTSSISAAVSANHLPENRLAFHASRANYPLPASYPVRPYIPSASSSHQSSTDVNSGQRVLYSNPLPKGHVELHQGSSRQCSNPNKENGEILGLDLKYLKKREFGNSLQGLNQNVASGKSAQIRTVNSLTHSAYFPNQAPS
ncbi:spindle assembly abnormal protein 6 homolog [Pelobates fuscus]|uniref:spindle assembly abnormal protein 6 homolog n=1 Tax=Pelobates fuscus TaxID=191477 RepID=UPI002FE4BF7B